MDVTQNVRRNRVNDSKSNSGAFYAAAWKWDDNPFHVCVPLLIT